MSGRKLRWLTTGLFAGAGAGMLSLTAMMNPAFAFGDDIGLVIGGSGLPIPGPLYVESADGLFLDNPLTKLFPDLTFYQATTENPFGNGLFTPEGLYPLTGVHTLPLNLPTDPTTGFPSLDSSVGQGMSIIESTIAADAAGGNTSTVFGYSQSATIASEVMKQLDPNNTPNPDSGLNFLLIGDPSAPNGGLLERFNGFETMSGQSNPLELQLPSLGVAFDGATPADDYPTTIYSLEYDGFTDFPRYPMNFLADLNAFLGIAEIHGHYLTYALGDGPSPSDIANAVHLPVEGASLTNYDMITTIDDGVPIQAPLVSLLGDVPVIGKPLEDLLGPDLTVMINLGYGDGTTGYSTDPANIPTPFGLAPDVSPTTVMNEMAAGAQTGFAAFEHDLSSFSLSSLAAPGDMANPVAELQAALADPASLPTPIEIANALSSVASTAYSTLLPTQDIINALTTSLPAYEATLFTENLQAGDLVDAFGLPMAANTALDTLAAGFEFEVLSDAASTISATLSGLF